MSATRTRLVAAVALTLSTAGLASAATYSTPFAPGTPRTLALSYSGTTGASPTWLRALGSSAEPNAAPPTGISTSTAAYQTASFTPSVSGLYEFYSAQSADGYLHLYADPFNPTSQLTNIRAGDDDMTVLNGGVVPNRGGVTGSADSGFSVNLTAGQPYTIVTSRFSGTAAMNFYNEVYRAATPSTPSITIPDNNATGASVTLSISDPGTITSFNSATIRGLTHSWIGDLVVTLTNVESGITVDLIDRVGRNGTVSGTGINTVGSESNVAGDYTFVDGGPAIPSLAPFPVSVAPGTYGLFPNGTAGETSSANNPLSAFAGLPIAGTWVLSVSDRGALDLGTFGGLSIDADVFVPEPATLGLLAGVGLLALRRR